MEELRVIATWGLAPIGALVSILFLWNLFLSPFDALGERIERAVANTKSEDRPIVNESDVKTPERANHDLWKHVQIFEAWQVIYLCAGLSPVNAHAFENDAVRAMRSEILGAIQHNQIVTYEDDSLYKDPEFRRIERDELKKYFAKRGTVPPFLT